MKIAIKDLWMKFPDRRRALRADKTPNTIDVLENINLSISDGEFVCVVGPSGCGKSTLLNIIGGFLPASSGEVLIDGQPVLEPNPKRMFIFQENSVFPWLTVEENIGFGLLNKPVKERNEIVTHYINMVGLTGFERSYPRELSGGMKQRAEIARALASNPDVLYMDEPFGALDFLTRLRMRAELIQIWEKEKKTVIFVTHDVEESVQLADRVVVMSRRPATIHSIVDVKLSRPRDLDSPEYLALRDQIFNAMGLDHSGMSNTKQTTPVEPKFSKTSSQAIVSKEPVVIKEPVVNKELIVNQEPSVETDVIIIGGGPAGAVLGTYLSKAGLKTIIVDKTHHPRAHVGESLSYSTCNVLKEIDFLQVMEEEGFITKPGVCWSNWYNKERTMIEFQGLGEFPYTYQVDRARFDRLLLEHAQKNGVQIISGVTVSEVCFKENGFADGIKIRMANSEVKLSSKLVADASGRQALLARQLKLLKPDQELRQFAIHSWFTGIDDEYNRKGFTQLHVLPTPGCWVWQIPISKTITSIGIVASKDNFVKAKEDKDLFFQSLTKLNPNLSELLKNAQRVRDWQLDGNYSYSTERFIGNGWLAVGDAAFFVDPIFSSGLSNAMHSSKFASEVMIKALSTQDISQCSFASYETKMRGAEDILSKFIKLFYRTVPIFSQVIANQEIRSVAIQLCEGQVYDTKSQTNLLQVENVFSKIIADVANPLNKLVTEHGLSGLQNQNNN